MILFLDRKKEHKLYMYVCMYVGSGLHISSSRIVDNREKLWNTDRLGMSMKIYRWVRFYHIKTRYSWKCIQRLLKGYGVTLSGWLMALKIISFLIMQKSFFIHAWQRFKALGTDDWLCSHFLMKRNLIHFQSLNPLVYKSAPISGTNDDTAIRLSHLYLICTFYIH